MLCQFRNFKIEKCGEIVRQGGLFLPLRPGLTGDDGLALSNNPKILGHKSGLGKFEVDKTINV